jgi:hypothetical protein
MTELVEDSHEKIAHPDWYSVVYLEIFGKLGVIAGIVRYLPVPDLAIPPCGDT